MKANEILYPFDESLAVKIADVLGSSSAAALALTALAKRREAGEDVYLFCASSTLVVGPWPVTLPAISEYDDEDTDYELSDALKKISPERLNELLREELG